MSHQALFKESAASLDSSYLFSRKKEPLCIVLTYIVTLEFERISNSNEIQFELEVKWTKLKRHR